MNNQLRNMLINELSWQEKQEINGGLPNVGWWILGIITGELLDRDSIQDFKDGWNAAKATKNQ